LFIEKAIEKALFDEDFRRFVREIENPYGVGNSAETIVNLLKKIDLKQVSIQKVFYEEQ
jgi:UDP-N-acetylglucosamine 2-epimerase